LKEKSIRTVENVRNPGRPWLELVAVQMLINHCMTNSLAPQNDQKTILLATDDAGVLRTVTASLVQNNYNVLAAVSGENAVMQMEDYKEEIHLLLAALDMPGVNGLGLAAQVSMKWPDLKVLLMSECRGGTLILNEGWHFSQGLLSHHN
jgi:PleD family two-component response regulator